MGVDEQVVEWAEQVEASEDPVVVHVLSDSTGNTAVRLVEAGAAQFRQGRVGISLLSNVQSVAQFQAYLDSYVADNRNTVIYHTILNCELRKRVREENERRGIASVDLLGPAMGVLQQLLGEKPLNIPGLEVNRAGRVIRRLDARML